MLPDIHFSRFFFLFNCWITDNRLRFTGHPHRQDSMDDASSFMSMALLIDGVGTPDFDWTGRAEIDCLLSVSSEPAAKIAIACVALLTLASLQRPFSL